MTDQLKNIREDLLKHQQDDLKSFSNIEQMLYQNTVMLERHDKEFAEMKEMIRKIAEDSKPVNQWFQNASYFKSTMIWIIGVIGTIIAIAIGIKNLFHST